MLILILHTAFLIRLFSVVRYESIIHEFDPYVTLPLLLPPSLPPSLHLYLPITPYTHLIFLYFCSICFVRWFNFRTTQHIVTEGFMDFLNWFDDRSWYPLGRHIGGTIYPGMKRGEGERRDGERERQRERGRRDKEEG